MKKIHISIWTFLILFTSQQSVAQTTLADSLQLKSEAEQLVRFLYFSLNTIGDSASNFRDKETIINESYLKYFANEKVQIEDDLDLNRKTVLYKSVQDYLKDIDFFYKHIQFDFEIENSTVFTNDSNMLVCKTTLRNSFSGIDLNKEKVKNTVQRHIEMNYDAELGQLKIASIYSNEPFAGIDWMQWWEELPIAWRNYFIGKEKVPVRATEDDIKKLQFLTKIDASDDKRITEIGSIAVLADLKSLNISGTAVNDLSAIRMFSQLNALDFSNTTVASLKALSYLNQLETLIGNFTLITSIDALAGMDKLKHLSFEATSIDNIENIAQLSQLETINLSRTEITDWKPLEKLTNLREATLITTQINAPLNVNNWSSVQKLDLTNSSIKDIKNSDNLKAVKLLYLSGTHFTDINSLVRLPQLKTLYIENTNLQQQNIASFQSKRPDVLVVFNSQNLQSWWQNLPAEWKLIFTDYHNFAKNPGVEELHRLSQLDSVHLNRRAMIKNLEPLTILKDLRFLDASFTSISDIAPLAELQNLKIIHLSNTPLTDISPLKNHLFLEYLDASNTKIESITVLEDVLRLQTIKLNNCPIDSLANLKHHSKLQLLELEQCPIPETQIRDFSFNRTDVDLIYKTEKLKTWWQNLSPTWQLLVREPFNNLDPSQATHLHRIYRLKELEIGTDDMLDDLSPIAQFPFLTKLTITGYQTNNLDYLKNLDYLAQLELHKMPLNNIEILANNKQMVYLSLANTSVKDISVLSELKNLKYLDISGTQVKSLQPVLELNDLVFLSVANTRIGLFSKFSKLPAIDYVECYNTPIFLKPLINKYKKNNPGGEVIYF